MGREIIHDEIAKYSVLKVLEDSEPIEVLLFVLHFYYNVAKKYLVSLLGLKREFVTEVLTSMQERILFQYEVSVSHEFSPEEYFVGTTSTQPLSYDEESYE